jgi:CBS domain-containing protein
MNVQAQCSHTALRIMLEQNVTAVAVLDSSETWVTGLLTQTDYLRKIALPEANAQAATCSSIMTAIQDTAYVLPDNDVESCLAVMAELKVHHLPVLDLRGSHDPHGTGEQTEPSSTSNPHSTQGSIYEQPVTNPSGSSASSSAGCGASWGGAASRGVLALPMVDSGTAEGRAALAQARCALLGVISFEELLGLNQDAQARSAARLQELQDEPSKSLRRLLSSLRGSELHPQR